MLIKKRIETPVIQMRCDRLIRIIQTGKLLNWTNGIAVSGAYYSIPASNSGKFTSPLDIPPDG